jgi:hypothetical protein
MQAQVTKVYGKRAPGATGWDRTLVWCDISDGTHYAGVFDDGMDFVPDSERVPQYQLRIMQQDAESKGWTEDMTPEEVAKVCNLRVGDQLRAVSVCVLY